MADLKISQLPAATTPLAGTEVLPIVQSGTTVQVSVDNLLPADVTTADNTQTLTNKTISFTDNTLTGVVGLDATQTLTNKTLTTPVITGGTVDGAPIGFRNIPPVGTKNSSYTLTTADVGEYVQIGSGGSITIPDAVFAEGDVVSLFNNTSGTVTITCSITTAYIGGADADKATMTLAARGVATILFISSTVCVVNGNVA